MPQALSLGVEYELFWQLNPRKLEPFIDGFIQRMKLQQEQTNFASWLSGMYVTHAIAVCFGKNHQYPSNPIGFKNTDEDVQIKEKVKQFETLAVNYNLQYAKEHTSIY